MARIPYSLRPAFGGFWTYGGQGIAPIKVIPVTIIRTARPNIKNNSNIQGTNAFFDPMTAIVNDLVDTVNDNVFVGSQPFAAVTRAQVRPLIVKPIIE